MVSKVEPKYFIKTFGCQANKSDSERIAGDYQARGYIEVSNWRDADEIVINTCAVRERAEDRVSGFLQNIKKFFGDKTKPKIILTGCMIHHGSDNLRKNLPLIDEVLPIGEVGFNSPAIRQDKKHAWIPISTGCNSFCTYCIVPYARGRETSRPMAEIMSEVEELAKSGYDEITLLGQNVNSYGLEKTNISKRKGLLSNQSAYHSPKGIPPFVALIRQISLISQITKINFMTSNPWDFWDELIDEIATNKKIDRFIHLPVQSGSDRILKLMNRGYTSGDYLSLINRIKSKIKDVQIGTDIIVGFPGETDEDFQATVDLAKQVGWQIAFVSQYSPRPGTVAHRIYTDDVPVKVKKERWQILDNIINQPTLKNRPIIH